MGRVLLGQREKGTGVLQAERTVWHQGAILIVNDVMYRKCSSHSLAWSMGILRYLLWLLDLILLLTVCCVKVDDGQSL